MSPSAFSARLLAWFDVHGRHDLPWQHPRTAYRVWLSEVMLQQTQVATVIGYFERFIACFPSVQSLAAAPLDDVLTLWAGLGYYARARNLHRCAQVIVNEYDGHFPQDPATLQTLPGIGRSTAAAIAAQAFGARAAILDGNVRRVLARRLLLQDWPGAPRVQTPLWAHAEALLPQARLADYTQALMDLGATLCTARKPQCARCPVASDCPAFLQNCTDQYPKPKPRAPRPHRHAHVLLIENARGQWLFQRRPARGIWGGLWTPPLLGDAAIGGDNAHWLTTGTAVATLPDIHHGFTHFDLTLAPLHLRCTHNPQGDDNTRWVTLAASQTLGLPAPIRKLMDTLT